jgi:predicted small secreted protein
MLKALLLLAILFGSSALVACNTVEGAGKDTERAGEKMQDTADRNR